MNGQDQNLEHDISQGYCNRYIYLWRSEQKLMEAHRAITEAYQDIKYCSKEAAEAVGREI